MKTHPGFKMILTVLALGLTIGAYAQKLPGVQAVSLRVPANVKIDGKAAEWGDQFQAFNKTGLIYYTMANDDDNLYLVVQVRDDDIAQKVVRGGITLTISVSSAKKEKDNPAVTFPQYDKKDPPKHPVYKRSFSPSTTAAENNLYLDSLAKARNRQLGDWAKMIGVAHLSGITQPDLSLYNEEGIKVALRFDSNLYCVYELAVPLKYFGFSLGRPAKFSYQIKLNGAAANGTNIRDLREGIFWGWDGADGKMYTERIDPDVLYPTDFWGEYTLAKKP